VGDTFLAVSWQFLGDIDIDIGIGIGIGIGPRNRVSA
jgi:hypothetical protein